MRIMPLRIQTYHLSVGTRLFQTELRISAHYCTFISQIGTALKATCVVVRSTVEPGTVNGPVQRILEETSGKSADTHFGVCFQPEFLREGSSIRAYDRRSHNCLLTG